MFVPLLSDVRSKAVKELPLLQNLQKDLATLAYMYCRATLDLSLPADKRGQQSVGELNKVLLEYLSQDTRGRHLRTFGALELERCLGVQHIRCSPFSWDKLYKRNWAQYTTMVPPHKYSGIAFRDFNLANAEHRREMWVGRVELLLTATFKNSCLCKLHL